MIAVLFLPDLPLVALCRADPEVAHAVLAVVAGSLESGSVCAVTPRAQELGAHAGMRLVQARALYPDLEIQSRNPALESSAKEALRDVAFSMSPRVELGEGETTAWAALDVSGLARLVGPPKEVARTLVRRAERLGLPVRVGVARTKTLARILAMSGSGCEVLEGGEAAERAYLKDLPLRLLEPSPALLQVLLRFGLRTVGELWAMPRAALVTRVGPEAARLLDRALGEEAEGGLVPTSMPAEMRERTQLEWAVDNLEPLAFVLRGLLDRLVARLCLFGFAAGDLHLHFDFDGAGGCERFVKVASPMRDVRALLELCRVHLAEHPPEQAVTVVTVSAEPVHLRERQLSLFEPAGPSPEKLAVTLARLQALCGEGTVGSPAPEDSYTRDAFTVVPFAPGRKVEPPASHSVPVTLRRFRPPRPVEVVCARGRPVRVSGPGFGGRVQRARGPFRRSMKWWGGRGDDSRAGGGGGGGGGGEQAEGEKLLCETYDVTLTDGTAYRVTLDCAAGSWFAEGWYD